MSFERKVAILAGGTFASQLLTLVAAPILTRIYTPSDFGTLGVFLAMLGIFSAFASLRLEFAIPIPVSERRAATIVLLGLCVLPIASVLSIPMLVLAGDEIAKPNSQMSIYSLVILLPLAIALTGVQQIATYWATRHRNFAIISKSKVLQTVVLLMANICLFKLGALGLVISNMLALSISTWIVSSAAVFQDKLFSLMNVRSLKKTAIQFRNFPLFAAPAGVINTATLALPVLLLSVLYDPFFAGQFALLQRVLTLPFTLLGSAISQVYFVEAASNKQRGKTIRPLFLRTSLQLFLAGIIPAFTIAFFGPQIFSIGFGAEWVIAGQWSSILAIVLIIQLVVSPLSQNFNLFGKQRIQLVVDTFRLVAVSVAFASVLVLHLLPDEVLTIYSIIMALSYLGSWAIQFHFVGSHPETPVRTCHL